MTGVRPWNLQRRPSRVPAARGVVSLMTGVRPASSTALSSSSTCGRTSGVPTPGTGDLRRPAKGVGE
eukprot:12667917-Alexandrium_andersonii.AAC.1